MTIDTCELMALAEDLSKERGLRVTVKNSLRGGLITGVSAFLGGLLAGAPGLAVGGTLGGCVAAVSASGTFKPVAQVLYELPAWRKEELARRVQNIVRNLDATDAMALAAIVAGNASIQQRIVSEVISYVRSELQMQICD